MSAPTPKIDERTAVAIANQVQDLLELYTADPVTGVERWQERFDPLTREPKSSSAALVGVFARYAELIIQRLNQVPDKNFLAFLDLLGASLLPPQPARAPLTFSLAAGSIADAVVPQGTQVAAPPAEGETEPVVFETEQELVVTAVQLASLFTRDPQQDMAADYSTIISGTGAMAVPLFRGNQQLDHILYLGHEQMLGYPKIKRLKLVLSLAQPLGDGGQLAWEMWDGSQWKPCPTPVGNLNLDQAESTITFSDIDGIDTIPVSQINGERNRWLRSRLLTPITPTDEIKSGMVRDGQKDSQLPIISDIDMTATIERQNLIFEKAFTNATAVDLSKDFFPFGEQPKFGDTFYLAHSEAFAAFAEPTDGTDNSHLVSLNVTLTAAGVLPRPPQTSNVKLAWEFWNGSQWSQIGTSIAAGGKPGGENEFTDPTNAFTTNLDSTEPITFTFPEQPQATSVNGVTDYWLRVRIVAGNYGQAAQLAPQSMQWQFVTDLSIDDVVMLNDEQLSGELQESFAKNGIILSITEVSILRDDLRWQVIDIPKKVTYRIRRQDQTAVIFLEREGFVNEPATFAPPSIKKLAVSYNLTESAKPKQISSYNDFRYTLQKTGKSFKPFAKMEDERPTLYYGFALPPARLTFPNRTLTLFNRTADFKYGEKTIPLWPLHSRATAVAGTVIRHTFTITNPTVKEITYNLKFLGTEWPTTISKTSVTVEAGKSEDIFMNVTTPSGAAISSSDQGFVQLWDLDKPQHTYNATFSTFVGTSLPPEERLQLVWQYWNGRSWSKLTVQDGSENFTRSGLAQFLPPADITAYEQFGQTRYWLRVFWDTGDYKIEPRLQRALLNTVMAAQTITIRNEIIGSSDGSEKQSFRANRSPILSTLQLDVREAEQPSAEEKTVIYKEEGPQAIVPTNTAREFWIRWHETTDFYASGPRDRHYVLNHLTGEITFGDGLNGLIPPLGNGNLRLTKYQTGGGTNGNKAANSVIQLKTTVPYVDKVTNTEAASGGSGAESLDHLRQRMPRTIRHRGRAVTVEDYEDLAMLASTAVARARCVPLYDLSIDPDATQRRPGTISLIIVPQTTEAKPSPSLELLSRVQTYVDARRLPNITLVVVGPEYVRVDITVEIALISLQEASKVGAAVNQTLNRFLHPLTGGLDGKGWGFGRNPHKSDLYALLETVPGVDHIRRLIEDREEDREGTLETGRFLVYSGTHTITLMFKE